MQRHRQFPASPKSRHASPTSCPAKATRRPSEFAWRFVNIIACALVALGRRPDYQQVRRQHQRYRALVCGGMAKETPEKFRSAELGD